MIGLVIVTHGNLALEFKSAMEHVVGAQENVETICIGPDDDMEKDAPILPMPPRVRIAGRVSYC